MIAYKMRRVIAVVKRGRFAMTGWSVQMECGHSKRYEDPVYGGNPPEQGAKVRCYKCGAEEPKP